MLIGKIKLARVYRRAAAPIEVFGKKQRFADSGIAARTGRVEVETESLGVQVPLNEIGLAIARWKEEEQTS